MKRLLLLVALATNLLLGAAPVALAQTTPALTINDVSVVEGYSGSTADFTVTLSAASSQVVTVSYATANATAINTARAGSDYTATAGRLTFAPGVTQQKLAVPIIGDASDELDEIFLVNLTSPTNATLADGQGKGTIHNDERMVFINDVHVPEGDSGTATALFTLELSAASAHSITVDYATAHCTTEKNDYYAATGSVTFAPGVTRRTITVTITGDQNDESNELFVVRIGAHHALVEKFGRGRGVILDDDPIKIAGDERCL